MGNQGVVQIDLCLKSYPAKTTSKWLILNGPKVAPSPTMNLAGKSQYQSQTSCHQHGYSQQDSQCMEGQCMVFHVFPISTGQPWMDELTPLEDGLWMSMIEFTRIKHLIPHWYRDRSGFLTASSWQGHQFEESELPLSTMSDVWLFKPSYASI